MYCSQGFLTASRHSRCLSPGARSNILLVAKALRLGKQEKLRNIKKGQCHSVSTGIMRHCAVSLHENVVGFDDELLKNFLDNKIEMAQPLGPPLALFALPEPPSACPAQALPAAVWKSIGAASPIQNHVEPEESQVGCGFSASAKLQCLIVACRMYGPKKHPCCFAPAFCLMRGRQLC